jgi:large subunit ribosomal protein L24
MHIRVDDTVEVLCGAYSRLPAKPGETRKRYRGKVLKVLGAEGKIVVEGFNLVYKHMRRSQRNPQGGRLSKEMPIPASNVALVCESCGKPTRSGVRYRDDGSKERYCKKCGAGAGLISPPRAAYAKK